MEVPATRQPGELALALDGETAPGAFLERVGLAKFKWPERIEIVTDFPMTSSGKLSKPRLKEIIREKLKQETAAMSPAPDSLATQGMPA